MRRSRRRHGASGRFAGLVVVAALALAGCSAGGGGADGSCDTSRGTLVIGLVAPLTGELASVGLGMRNSAGLAVDQANERCAVPGYHLSLNPQDDRGQPAVGQAAAQSLLRDPKLVGVVGTYNSSVAQAVQPLLARADVAMISPGNTSTTLTRGQNPVSAPLRQYGNYFRVVANDAVQGPAAAEYLAGPAGKRRIAVLSDGGTYGDGIAAEFAKQLPTVGGQVVARQVVPPRAPRAAAIAAVVRARPDAVFYGGEYPDGGPLSRDLAAAGMTVPVMGGDGVVNPGYVAAGGRDGDLGTSVGVPPETSPSARAFVAAYARAGYPETFGAYGAFSYDAADVLVTSVATALGEDGTWTPGSRSGVVDAVQGYAGDGASGPLSFDRFGDVQTGTVSVYRMSGGRWNVVTPPA